MKRFLRRNKVLVIRILPAFFIFVLFASGFLNIPGRDLGKTLILISLLIVTPILFFINGFLSQKFKCHFLIFSVPSYISFLLIFLIWMNSSALAYFPMYLLFNFLGFMFFKFDKNLTEKNKIKLDNSGFYSDKK
jgi:hypothetical protein